MRKIKPIWLIMIIVAVIIISGFCTYWFGFRTVEKIVFIRSGDIWTMSQDGSNQKQITIDGQKGRYSHWPVISPNGRYIVFVRTDNLWLMSANGKEQKQITDYQDGQQCVHPIFSPDGKKISFSLIDGPEQDIWTVNIDGSDAKRLTNTGLTNDYPYFTPSGKEIVYSGLYQFEEIDLPQIHIMNSDGSNQHSLTQDSSIKFINPVISPKGEKIIFWAEGLRETNFRAGGLGQSLYLVNKDSTNLEKIERSKPVQDKIPEDLLATAPDDPELILVNILKNRLPDWSPNGKKIVFTSNYDNNKICQDGTDIFVMDMETKEVTRLTDDCFSNQAVWGKIK